MYDESLLIEAIANYMVVTGARETSEGNWCFYFSDLAEKFQVTVDWLKQKEDDIKTEIWNSGAVVDDGDGIWVYDQDGDRVFDLNFFTDYCGLSGVD